MTPLILFLLGCATVFLGSIQAAFSALMRLSLRLMAERGGRDDRLGEYLDDPLHLFIPVRVLIGVSTVLAGVLIARLSDVRDALSVVTFIVSLVAFVVVCEHLLPMLIVRRDPERVLDVMLPAFHAVATVLIPITTVLLDLIDMRREREAPGNGHAADDAAPSAAGEKKEAAEGAISEEEGRELLQSIVDFTGTVVREVMTPRPDIIAIRVDATLQDLRTLFREEQYSRIPVYRDSLDNIVGIVFVKDLVALPHGAEPPMTTLMRTAHFVPESKRVSELLKEMQRRQTQMAIVVDEYGGTAGLVTVEDLLEEIVGEIRDEYDVESETVTDEGNGNFVFSGKVSVDEVRERLDVEIEREGFETVGGYLLSHLGRMPYVGETIEVGDLGFEVIEVERRRITKVRARRHEQSPVEASLQTRHGQ
ncbi:MAG TPA: hemolysin family protein [Vicinamibacterales bacterium]|jgi:putative hemolysin|nr:hemolysin family protein [Vicinamibacterales bacterium]